MNEFTNGIMIISDGTIKGKIIVIGTLLIFAVFFIIRANLQWKIIDHIHEKAGDNTNEILQKKNRNANENNINVGNVMEKEKESVKELVQKKEKTEEKYIPEQNKARDLLMKNTRKDKYRFREKRYK